MSTYAIQDKITIAEAHQWLLNAHEEWTQKNIDSLEGNELDQLMINIASLKPKDFKVPRRKSAPKKKSSNSERSQMEYDESRCDARCWADGFGAQCSKKKIDGSIFCKTCNKDNKDGNKVGLRNGLFTETRPTHEWGDESNKVLGWRDADGNKPEKKKKSSKKSSDGGETNTEKKPRKCGYCRCEGHTKATCPKIKEDLTETDEVKALKEQLAAAQAKIAQHESASDEEKTVACEVGLDVANLDDVKDEELEEDLSPKSKTAAGVGEIKEDQVEEDQVEEDQVEEDQVEEDPVELAKQAKDDRVNKLEINDDEDNEDNEDNEGFIAITMEGVNYDRDENDVVYDDGMNEVGKWDGEKIIFSKKGLRNHNKSKEIINDIDGEKEDEDL